MTLNIPNNFSCRDFIVQFEKLEKNKKYPQKTAATNADVNKK